MSVVRADTDGSEEGRIGARLRALRTARGLSLKRLSLASSVPVSTISKIENGQLNPSLVHAINLASALDENLGFLVPTQTRPSPLVVSRAAERPAIAFPEMGLSLEDLNGPAARGRLEARLGIIAAGAHSGEEPMRHAGEELAHVLSGGLDYDVAGTAFALRAGDTLHFKSDQPHRWRNAADGPTRVLWVFSDGLSF
ncbi:MAG: XRE family transcriptional regulator [Devosia sp.]